MRVLWISCLLIGSITCVPVMKDSGSNNPGTSFMRPPLSPWPVFRREWGSSPGSSSSLPSLSSPSFDNAAQLPASHSSGHGDSGLGGSYGGYGSSDSSLGGSYGGYGSSDGGLGGSYGGYGSSDSGLGGSYGGYGSSDSGLGGGYGGYGSSDSGLGGSYGGYGSSDSGYVGASYGHVAPHDESSSSGSGAGTENPEPVFSDVSDLEPVYSYSSRSSYQRGQEVFAQTRYTPLEPVPPFPLSRHSSKAAPQPKAPTKGGF